MIDPEIRVVKKVETKRIILIMGIFKRNLGGS